MIKKLATLILAGAFSLAIYSPAADACPGMEDTSVAKKDKKKEKKKVADKKKAKEDKADKKKAKKKKKDGKKVSRK